MQQISLHLQQQVSAATSQPPYVRQSMHALPTPAAQSQLWHQALPLQATDAITHLQTPSHGAITPLYQLHHQQQPRQQHQQQHQEQPRQSQSQSETAAAAWCASATLSPLAQSSLGNVMPGCSMEEAAMAHDLQHAYMLSASPLCVDHLHQQPGAVHVQPAYPYQETMQICSTTDQPNSVGIQQSLPFSMTAHHSPGIPYRHPAQPSNHHLPSVLQQQASAAHVCPEGAVSRSVPVAVSTAALVATQRGRPQEVANTPSSPGQAALSTLATINASSCPNTSLASTRPDAAVLVGMLAAMSPTSPQAGASPAAAAPRGRLAQPSLANVTVPQPSTASHDAAQCGMLAVPPVVGVTAAEASAGNADDPAASSSPSFNALLKTMEQGQSDNAASRQDEPPGLLPVLQTLRHTDSQQPAQAKPPHMQLATSQLPESLVQHPVHPAPQTIQHCMELQPKPKDTVSEASRSAPVGMQLSTPFAMSGDGQPPTVTDSPAACSLVTLHQGLAAGQEAAAPEAAADAPCSCVMVSQHEQLRHNGSMAAKGQQDSSCPTVSSGLQVVATIQPQQGAVTDTADRSPQVRCPGGQEASQGSFRFCGVAPVDQSSLGGACCTPVLPVQPLQNSQFQGQESVRGEVEGHTSCLQLHIHTQKLRHK